MIDLHEEYDFHQINSKSVGSSIIDAKGKAADIAVPKMLAAVNATITDPKKKLVRLRYPVDGSLARAAHERLGAASMILETTFKSQPLSKRARQHRLMVHALLTHLQMVDSTSQVMLSAKTEALRVAVYDAGGVGSNGPRELDRVLRGMPATMARRVGAEDIRNGVLTQFDVAIFPGGSGSKQAAALMTKGGRPCRPLCNGVAGMWASVPARIWRRRIIRGRSESVITKHFAETIDLPNIGRKSMWYREADRSVKMELTAEGRRFLRSQGRF